MEAISVFDIFKIGVGPSSSHTMGPWRAAQRFVARCKEEGPLQLISAVQVDLFGSLAKTGRGHGTDIAVMLGLMNEDPVTCDTAGIFQGIATLHKCRTMLLGGETPIAFDPDADIRFHGDRTLPFHPNGLTFHATASDSRRLSETYYSVGGGFVVQENQSSATGARSLLPYPIESAAQLKQYCISNDWTIPEVVRRNERAWRSDDQISSDLQNIWNTMKQCIHLGCTTDGVLPGGLNVVRRAASIFRKLHGAAPHDTGHSWPESLKGRTLSFGDTLKWVSCFALAVNEQNASFGRVVTAPTNGAAGVIPAVLAYYYCFGGGDGVGIETFLLTAGELGSIFKKGATLSAAQGGCQAEIGVSSAMAAGGLTQCLGGSVDQVLMAAEIAMEHHLGLTCDPVGGLVQIPCIERNTMGAIKAITAANLALAGDPANARVSLDAVIKTMWQTALDMNTKYKETSEGGLALQIAVNLSEC